MVFRVTIDNGGTFTDALSVDDKGNVVTAKVPTTPKEVKLGTINAINALAKRNNLELKQFLNQTETIIHGTTLGTNVIVTRIGPKLGIITTQGHRDAIHMRRVTRENIWDWRESFPQPLVPRHLRVEVEERVGSRGEVIKSLNEDSVHKAVAYLRKMKVESIVVTLIFSFLNPEHEKRIREIIKEDYPNAYVTLSHEVLPVVGEYERFSTAVIDAYIRPAINEYAQTLEDFLRKEGLKGQFLFMQNNGGVETAEIAMAKPGTTAMSGPAAGPSTALRIGELHGNINLISIDMGGTSFDFAIIDSGKFTTKTESLVADYGFYLPVIDVESIGAGGGSIAWFDASGTLRVGPRSAGADPGPACYGIGGEEATITDANVVLGYISPDYFLGGEMKLKRNLAEKVIKMKVADRLGISIQSAANAIYKISNSVMADGLSRSFARRGYDPRDFALCAGGAAAPTCILKIAQELGIARVLISKYAPIYSAFGMLCIDLRHDFARFHHAAADSLNLDEVKGLYKEMEAEAFPLLEKEGVPEHELVLLRTVRMRYLGQFRDVEVLWPSGPITKEAIVEGIANFHNRHNELYGSSDENYPVEVTGFGLSAIGSMPRVTLKEIRRGSKDASSALKGERDSYFEESNGFVKTRVYDGDELLSGNVLEGPCVVEERMTNLVIPPTFKMCVDKYGNYITA